MRPRPTLLLPVLVVGALFLVVLAVLPRSGVETVSESTTTEAPEVGGPFGPPLEAALGYLGSDRVLYLLDLRDGGLLGSKTIPADRRPAAVSSHYAYLGRLSDFLLTTNWDAWRAVPWAGTMYHDLGPGNWITIAPGSDVVVEARRPLADGRSGLVRSDAGGKVLAASDGLWGMMAWTDEWLVARELSGAEERWWLVDAVGESPPVPAAVPEGFVPAAGGGPHLAGFLGGEGVIVDPISGDLARIDGPLSWAAAWDPAGETLVTVSADPPALFAYGADGAAVWARPLAEPVTALRGGVAWAPDGTFLVAGESGTLAAYRPDGERIGALDGLQPDPESDGSLVWVVALP
jgi:hypothetical protein